MLHDLSLQTLIVRGKTTPTLDVWEMSICKSLLPTYKVAKPPSINEQPGVFSQAYHYKEAFCNQCSSMIIWPKNTACYLPRKLKTPYDESISSTLAGTDETIIDGRRVFRYAITVRGNLMQFTFKDQHVLSTHYCHLKEALYWNPVYMMPYLLDTIPHLPPELRLLSFDNPGSSLAGAHDTKIHELSATCYHLVECIRRMRTTIPGHYDRLFTTQPINKIYLLDLIYSSNNMYSYRQPYTLVTRVNMRPHSRGLEYKNIPTDILMPRVTLLLTCYYRSNVVELGRQADLNAKGIVTTSKQKCNSTATPYNAIGPNVTKEKGDLIVIRRYVRTNVWCSAFQHTAFCYKKNSDNDNKESLWISIIDSYVHVCLLFLEVGLLPVDFCCRNARHFNANIAFNKLVFRVFNSIDIYFVIKSYDKYFGRIDAAHKAKLSETPTPRNFDCVYRFNVDDYTLDATTSPNLLNEPDNI